jgi:hypothetical protein
MTGQPTAHRPSDDPPPSGFQTKKYRTRVRKHAGRWFSAHCRSNRSHWPLALAKCTSRRFLPTGGAKRGGPALVLTVPTFRSEGCRARLGLGHPRPCLGYLGPSPLPNTLPPYNRHKEKNPSFRSRH